MFLFSSTQTFCLPSIFKADPSSDYVFLALDQRSFHVSYEFCSVFCHPGSKFSLMYTVVKYVFNFESINISMHLSIMRRLDGMYVCIVFCVICNLTTCGIQTFCGKCSFSLAYLVFVS